MHKQSMHMRTITLLGSFALPLMATPTHTDEAKLEVTGSLSRYCSVGETLSLEAVLTDGSETLTGASYTWDFGDGSQKTTGTDFTSVTHAFAAAGTYQVVVSASSGEAPATEEEFTCTVLDGGKKYVWVTPNGEHASDYDSPTNAAEAARKLIVAGESSVTVAVAPGTYRVLTPITLDKAISVIGVEGPEKTVFKGPNGDAKCLVMVTVSDADALFAGIAIDTIKNSWDYRGNKTVGAEMSAGVLSNCVIRGIGADWKYNAPSHGCALTMTGGLATEVVITNNISPNSQEIRNGAPVKLSGTALMDRCIVRDNECQTPFSAWLNNAFRNRIEELAGGGVYMASDTPVCRNTLIVGNRTQSQPGCGAYVVAGTLENCTVVGNYMKGSTNETWSSGIYAYEGAKVINCISDANVNGAVAINAGAEDGVDTTAVYTYSCLPGFASGGKGCTTADPQMDADYRPSASEVLGKGKKADWMKTALDLAGNPRLQGYVDMGCYECDAAAAGLIIHIR